MGKIKRRLIEWNIPLKKISELSAKERYITQGHPSSMHIWWARRPLASSRSTNFAALFDLPEDSNKRKETQELIVSACSWESLINHKDNSITTLRSMLKVQWEHPPKVLDPFSGGGSIPLEALRLGCETYANDLNPVAVLIEKATLEWPAKFGIMIENPSIKKKHLRLDGSSEKVNILSFFVEKWGNRLINNIEKKVKECYVSGGDDLYPLFFIWCKTIPCQNPSCGIEIPVLKQYWLSNKKKKKVALKPVLDKTEKMIQFNILKDGDIDFNPSEGTITRGKVKCPKCNQVLISKDVRDLGSQGLIKDRLICLVYYDNKARKRKYRIAESIDVLTFNKAQEYLETVIDNWEFVQTPLPDEKIPKSGTIGNITGYGINSWADLFNLRQKMILVSFLHELKSLEQEIFDDVKKITKNISVKDPIQFGKAVITYLGFLLDMHAASNNRCTRWRSTAESTTRMFARPNLPWIWDYVEASPFTTAASSLRSFLKYYVKTIEVNSINNVVDLIQVSNYSATSLAFEDDFFDAVITDPPYYDNISYAELSDFFYVWLKRSVGDLFPELFATPLTPKANEAIANRKRQKNPKEFFEKKIFDSFTEMFRVLKNDGILVVVYAHKSTTGWETLLNSLINAGFVITGSWPIQTEMKTRLLATTTASLTSSIYMVCRKLKKEEVGFFSEIKADLEKKIISKLKMFWNEGMIGGDFFIAVIGPAMEVFSKYKKVESLDGQEITVEVLLDYIRSVSTNYIVTKLLKSELTSGTIDKESQFYLSYRWTYMDKSVDFDDARKLASACGVDIEKLSTSKGFVRKDKSIITVLGPFSRVISESSENFVDIMHLCLNFWRSSDDTELKEFLIPNRIVQNPLFWQFCQAVSESLLAGSKEKRNLEGFLASKSRMLKQISSKKGLDSFI